MRFVLAVAALLIAAQPAGAADKPDDGKHESAAKAEGVPSLSDAGREAANAEAAAEWTRAPVKEAETTTLHTLNVAGKAALRYKATAGTLTIRDDEAKPTASVFYVAYTLDGGPQAAKRPVTFFYNGGPGSSSIWLHMGSFAPVRVQTDSPVTIRPAPYAFGPNPDTLLDKSDLVFIDAVGTGYSRPVGDATGKDFWGVDQDADAFTKAIMRYVTKNAR